MKIELTGYNEVNENGFSRPAPGGYVCKIVNAFIAQSKNDNPTVYVDVDIAQGECAGYFRNEFARYKKIAKDATWVRDARLNYVNLINGKIFFRLKKFLENLKASNPDFKFDPNNPDGLDTDRLIGLKIGVVFRGVESKSTDKNGNRYINVKAAHSATVQEILDGEFDLPPVEPYVEKQTGATSSNISDDYFKGTGVDPNDVPFM